MISLCMIVKNEEKNLERSLKSVKDYVDEIIIVDTGSTDRTKEIALLYTDKVFEYTWKNDFSLARNYSLEQATHDMVLVLDADEIVEEFDRNVINKLELGNESIGRMIRINEYTRSGVEYKFHERVGRLFSKSSFEYKGRIHEQLVAFNGKIPNYVHVPIVTRHGGYEGELETRKKKTERNIKLLLMELESSPNDTYLLYQLGKSYYMGEDYGMAVQYFDEMFQYEVNTELEYVQDGIESFGYALLNSQQYELALSLENVYDVFSNTPDFLFLMGMIYMNNGRFDKAVDEFIKCTKFNSCKMEGINSYLSNYNMGVIYECLGDREEAIKHYKLCGNYKLALERIQKV